MINRITGRSLCFVGTLFTLLLLGCSTPQNIPSPSSTTGTVIRAPFAALVASTGEQRRLLHDANERAIAACMKQRGFNYTPLRFKPDPASMEHLGDVTYAQAHGYGIDYAATSEDPNAAKSGSAQEQAFAEALLGKGGPDSPSSNRITVTTPDGTDSIDGNSCIAVAMGSVYGDAKEWFTLNIEVERLANETLQRTQADAGFAQADRSWRTCMAEAGHGSISRAEHVTKLRQKASTEGNVASARALEVEIAKIDAECVLSSGAGKQIDQLLRKYENIVAGNNQGVIIRYGELQKKALETLKGR